MLIDNILFLGVSTLNVLLSAILGFIGPWYVLKKIDREKLREGTIILGGICIVGATAGVLGGLSRVGVVGTVIPAFLSLIGSVSIYFFGLDRARGLLVSFGATGLSISLFFAYLLGSIERNESQKIRDIQSFCLDSYSNPNLLGSDGKLEQFERFFGAECRRQVLWLDNASKHLSHGSVVRVLP